MQAEGERILSSARISSAIRFWEPMRILFNLVLAAGFFAFGGGMLIGQAGLVGGAGVLVLAVAANVLYCLAYPVDLLTQASDWATGWRRYGRPLLFAIGTLTALALTFLTLLGTRMPFP